MASYPFRSNPSEILDGTAPIPYRLFERIDALAALIDDKVTVVVEAVAELSRPRIDIRIRVIAVLGRTEPVSVGVDLVDVVRIALATVTNAETDIEGRTAALGARSSRDSFTEVHHTESGAYLITLLAFGARADHLLVRLAVAIIVSTIAPLDAGSDLQDARTCFGYGVEEQPTIAAPSHVSC
ncbi:MAG: hypothetical protein RBU30_03790 [Polyangia bacterium]|jgi:hypothetical protein|nr:hypothetical protein [Polyangia bacterium]